MDFHWLICFKWDLAIGQGGVHPPWSFSKLFYSDDKWHMISHEKYRCVCLTEMVSHCCSKSQHHSSWWASGPSSTHQTSSICICWSVINYNILNKYLFFIQWAMFIVSVLPTQTSLFPPDCTQRKAITIHFMQLLQILRQEGTQSSIPCIWHDTFFLSLDVNISCGLSSNQASPTLFVISKPFLLTSLPCPSFPVCAGQTWGKKWIFSLNNCTYMHIGVRTITLSNYFGFSN